MQCHCWCNRLPFTTYFFLTVLYAAQIGGFGLDTDILTRFEVFNEARTVSDLPDKTAPNCTYELWSAMAALFMLWLASHEVIQNTCNIIGAFYHTSLSFRMTQHWSVLKQMAHTQCLMGTSTVGVLVGNRLEAQHQFSGSIHQACIVAQCNMTSWQSSAPLTLLWL